MSRFRFDRRTTGPVGLAWLAVIVLFVLVSLYSPGFANPANVGTLIIGASFIGIVAIGQTMVIVGGGIEDIYQQAFRSTPEEAP